MAKKIPDWVTAAMWWCSFSGWVAIAALLLLEPPWLSYETMPFKVLSPHVVAGDSARLFVKRCNSDNKTRIYSLSHELVSCDGKTPAIVLPPNATAIGPGCTGSESGKNNVIPEGTPAGCYYLRGFAESPGFVKNTLVPWSSERFQVVSR